MVRTRFAPSPTGELHIGGLRTALYAFAMAKANNGKFVLRIEDTDRKRFVENADENIEKLLLSLNLTPDEGPSFKASFGPYKQSERIDIYKKYAFELVKNGHAYFSFETKEELAEINKLAQNNNEKVVFRSKDRNLEYATALKRVESGESFVVRQKVPQDITIKLKDGLQGDLKFESNEVEDGVLLKSDGFPTYHLAVVIDDHLMQISDVFRGVEWIPSIPKHVLLYNAFGWKMPNFYHLPLILDPLGGKLSKRKGAVSVEEFFKQGYLKEALLNFLMLLGWSPPLNRVHGEKENEFFSLTDFIELFKPSDLNKSSPVFNREKLLWFNHKYIQNQNIDILQNNFVTWLKIYAKENSLQSKILEKGPDYLQKVLMLEKDRVQTFAEIIEKIKYFYFEPQIVDYKQVKHTKMISLDQYKLLLLSFKEELEKIDSISTWSHEEWEKSVREIAFKLDLKAGAVFMLLRLVITGSSFSPPLYEVLEVLEKEVVINRISKGLK